MTTKDDRCETTAGPYRCMHGKGHKDDHGNPTPCEAQAREYATSGRRINIDRQPLPEPKVNT